MNLDYLCFGLLGFIWGTNFLLMKLAVQVITPIQVTGVRILCGAVPIFFYALARRRLRLRDARHAGHFVILALTSSVLPYLGFAQAAQFLKSGATGSIAGIVPLMTAGLAALLLPEDRLTKRKVGGLALGFAGVTLVAGAIECFTGESTGQEMYGLAYTMTGALSYAIAVVYQRRFITPLNVSPVALACYQTAVATLILAAVVPGDGLENLLARPADLWLLMLGLGVVGTGIAFIMFYHVVEKMGAVTAASVYYLPPVTALVMGAVFANEAVTTTQALGAALILSGIYIARTRPVLTPTD